MLGTKCPSITSRWIQSAPAASTAATSSASFEKSDARIEGEMTRGRDANWSAMCAFPEQAKLQSARLQNDGVASGNMGQPQGQILPGSGINCRALVRNRQ